MDKQLTASGKPRKRAAVACNPCRAKRIKCDGNRPSCIACISSNGDCEYTNKECNRKPPSKRYVAALKDRIRLLELQLQQAQHHTATFEVPAEEAYGELDSDAESYATEDALEEDRSPIRDISDRLGRLNMGEDGQVRYFGSRSNFSLLRSWFRESSSASTCELRRQAADALERLNLRVDVPDELRDHLLDLYWCWQNTWQRLVVKETFLRDLHVDRTDLYATTLLLSAMLSLAARYSDRVELRSDPVNPNTAGDALAEQAKMLLRFEIEAPTVTVVQAAALLALRETATDKEALGWVYCGLATRSAFNLGLHLNCDRWREIGHISDEEAEVRNVTWWGCYILDKLFNIGLGRPSTIQEDEVTAPLPTLLDDDEYGPWSAVPAADPPLHLSSCYVVSNCRATCKLFKITSSALDEVYRPRNGRNKPRILHLISKTHADMMEFYTHLPSSLRLPPNTQHAAPHVYQLHLQYHVAVILLHRPFINVCTGAEGSTILTSNEASSHLGQCSSSASSISNIFKAYRKHYTLRRIPISAVHCAFTAAIIFLVKTTPSESEEHRRNMASLRVLACALADMCTAWAWSRRALSALQQLAVEWSVAEDVKNALGIEEVHRHRQHPGDGGPSEPAMANPGDMPNLLNGNDCADDLLRFLWMDEDQDQQWDMFGSTSEYPLFMWELESRGFS